MFTSTKITIWGAKPLGQGAGLRPSRDLDGVPSARSPAPQRGGVGPVVDGVMLDGGRLVGRVAATNRA